MSSWRIPPEPIPSGQIAKSYDAQVVVVGLGYAGTAALRASQEAGADTIGIEFMREDRYTAFGRDIGHLNSRFLASRGVPKVDPITFFNEWMRRAGNRANPELIMKFAQNSGGAVDWWTDMYSLDELKGVHVAFWPDGNEKFKAEARQRDFELNGYHFWNGTMQFPDPMGWPGHPTLPECAMANQKKAAALGARCFYSVEAMQLTKDGDRVTGVIGRERDGSYCLFRASKGVILAAGDFSGNAEMLKDLAVDIDDLFTPEESFRRQGGRSGRGIQMGVWAGGRLETRPLPTMGGNELSPGGLNGSFGTLWLDPDGRRFCNETFGGPEIAGFAGNQMKRGKLYNIFDEHVLEEDLQWSVPAHGGFDIHSSDSAEVLKSVIAYAKTHDEGKVAVTLKRGGPPPEDFTGDASAAKQSPPSPAGQRIVYYGRTPEELVKNAGIDGELGETIAAGIRRYSSLGELGRDEDFGKDPKLMRKLDGYLFLEVCAPARYGRMLVSVGGLVTDGNQNVLDMSYNRIPGLYASGNCCGRRYGPQYCTPIAGVSIGIAITLGREAGKAAAGAAD